MYLTFLKTMAKLILRDIKERCLDRLMTNVLKMVWLVVFILKEKYC